MERTSSYSMHSCSVPGNSPAFLPFYWLPILNIWFRPNPCSGLDALGSASGRLAPELSAASEFHLVEPCLCAALAALG
jgi:hypothetical protein